VEERLEMLNSGQGFSDEFEFEACNYTPKTSTINEQYSHWMSSMKKQGTAFFKTVKNRVGPFFRVPILVVNPRYYGELNSWIVHRETVLTTLPYPIFLSTESTGTSGLVH